MASRAEMQKEEILRRLRRQKMNHEQIAEEVDCSLAEVREYAIELLMERAILTRAVCREVREAEGCFYSRAHTALQLLQRWSGTNRGSSYASYREEEITASADDCKAVMQEIQDGQRVCSALSLLGTADSPSENQRDEEFFRSALAEYWAKHRRPSPRPPRQVVTV